ncbi:MULTISPECIES: MIP family channel protein [Duncaniella]|uniref:MIP family channel protein n=1 Tax=Duncaniella TaxID=2518495 RepID=UPI0010A4A79D|nr:MULTISPECIES: MIP family channel protein [Duncaniella]NBH92590.1 MIP family channel protein [Muribaculaceae bacterium S4]NBI21048.1 MIP family channel protein [Muribaculaceae bacterium Z1]MDE5689212.1 MIP family channel protein [Duncaniella sp.]MDE5904065.1 MIP family channel protein [Duncaniella sp.]QCD40489.1 MIP family channel protein [Duncaniella sp. C9]
MKKYLAEMIGTFVLVLMGCGSAIFAGIGLGTTGYGVTTLGVAMAFGLSVVAMAYTIGNISGCHINPAITLGVWSSGRMSGKEAGGYMLFQCIGAIIASAVLYILVHTGNEAGIEAVFNSTTTTGSNSFLPGNIVPAFIAELIFTFIFVLVVLGSTDEKKGAGNFAGLAIGLTLVLVHIACIPITGTSVNPARSIGPAIFAAIEGNCVPLSQLWLFIVAPFIGAMLSAFVWKGLRSDN